MNNVYICYLLRFVFSVKWCVWMFVCIFFENLTILVSGSLDEDSRGLKHSNLQPRSNVRPKKLEYALLIITVVLYNSCEKFKGLWFDSHQCYFCDFNYSGYRSTYNHG